MTYVYQCPLCGEERECIQRITSKPARLKCRRDGQPMKRVITGGNGFRLVGKDWDSKGRA